MLAVCVPSGLRWMAEGYVHLHIGPQWQPTSVQRFQGLGRSGSREVHCVDEPNTVISRCARGGWCLRHDSCCIIHNP